MLRNGGILDKAQNSLKAFFSQPFSESKNVFTATSVPSSPLHL